MQLDISKIKMKIAASQQFSLQEQLTAAAEQGFTLTGPLSFTGSIINQGAGRFMVKGSFAVEVGLACSRCLQPFTQQIAGEITALYTATALVDEIGELETRQFSGETIDVAPLLLSEIAFLLPMQPVCQADCQGLCTNCGCDLNKTTCSCAESKIDPRWEKLKDFRANRED